MKQARKLFLMAAVVVTAALAAAVPANAATVGIDQQGVLRYQGAPSEANQVRVYFDVLHWVYVIEDTGAASTTVTGKWCSAYGSQYTYCTTGRFNSIDVQLGDAGGTAVSQVALMAVTLRAGGGDDTLTGGPGRTTLVGGAGHDTLTAGSGTTDLLAGSGDTSLNGGTGHATYTGGPGADVVKARNGVIEDITCGGALDEVAADDGDTVASDCESVTRGVATATETPATQPQTPGALPGDLPGVAAKPPAPLTIAPVAASVTRANSVPVRLACPATSATGCEGTMTLSLPSAAKASTDGVVAARRRVISRNRRFRLAVGEKAVVPVRLTRRGARIFRARRGGRAIKRSSRRRKLIVTAKVKTEAGVKTVRSTITVHERRRPMPRKRARR